MDLVRTHIAFRLLSFILLVGLLAPSAVKIAHIFEHHKHVVCLGEDSTHIHQVDLDCQFHDFQLNNNFLVAINYCSFHIENEIQSQIISQYHFISDYQRLPFSLRGPPQVNLV